MNKGLPTWQPHPINIHIKISIHVPNGNNNLSIKDKIKFVNRVATNASGVRPDPKGRQPGRSGENED